MFFDEKLELDPEIAFHGTSNCFESTIDSGGLTPNRSMEWRGAIDRLVALFRELDWCGTSGASRAVLEPFSLNHDHGDQRGKPIYLAESSDRAVTFASKDFAGGENARALRHSFRDLRAFLDEPAIREEHLDRITRNLRARGIPQSVAFAQATKTLAAVDISKIRTELDALQHVEREVAHFEECHRYGLIYALRLAAKTMELEYHTSMGLKCFSVIDPRQIVSKRTVLPSEARRNRDDMHTIDKRMVWKERFCPPK